MDGMLFRRRVEHLSENTVTELLAALVTPARRADIDTHMATCASCRRLVSALLRRSATAPAFATGSPGRATPRSHAEGTKVGRYTLGARLGSGAAGTVMRAHDPELDRTVALKLLHPGDAQRERIQREARALAKLAHPNVVAVHDAGSDAGELFVAMELVEGTDLRAWMATPRSVSDILRTFRQIGDGLSAAHAAGIIHRDVKPENMLVGIDGRARVGDFGLAGGNDGVVEFIGTPAYMAPEQFEDGVASTATDQFAYCVSLYEALHGERPFTVNLAEEVAVGPRFSRAGVPMRVRAAIARGLAVDPERRFPSMTALVDALRLRRTRRWLFAAAIGVVAVGSAGFAAARFVAAAPAGCSTATAELDAVWNPARAEAIHARFAATGLTYAEDSWRAVKTAVDRFADEYRSSRVAACQATREQGRQSERLLDLRMQCLDRARTEASATLDLLAELKPGMLATAAATADALPSLESCSSATALLAPVPPPPSASAAGVTLLELDIARASALADAGQWAAAVSAATPLVERARGIAHPPTLARALFLLGRARSGAGDSPAAEAALREAFTSAEIGHDDLLAARAAVELSWVVGQTQSRYRDGGEWVFHARTLLERAGGDASLAARLAGNEGHIAYSSSHYDVALERYQLAYDSYARSEGPDSRAAAMALANLARAHNGLGDNASAQALSERAIAALERTLGPRHPDVGLALHALGSIQNNRGRFADALVSFDRALAIAEPSLGPDHPQVAESLINRGYVFTSLGRLDDAVVSLDRAIRILERPGALRDALEAALLGKGDAELAGEHLADALVTYERALQLALELDPDNTTTATALESCATVKLQLGRPADALADYRRALAIREAVNGAEYFENAYTHAGLGDAFLAQRDAEAAAAAYGKAVHLLDQYDGDPVTRATTRFSLAKALALGRAPASDVDALLTASEHELVAAGDLGAAPLAELRAWRHRIR